MRVPSWRSAISAAVLFALLPLSSPASVAVEASRTLTRELVDLPAGRVAAYGYALDAGSELVFRVRLGHWRRDPLRVWLVDAGNYERLLAGDPFDYFDRGTGMIRREAQIAFEPEESGQYFVVLDNSHSPSTREMDVYAYQRTDAPSPADERVQSFYEAYFDALSDLIETADIDVHVRRCGRVNAYAIGSRVVICRELDDLLRTRGTPGVRLFVLLHEVSHSLIDHWGYESIVRNQFMVDRLAAALFALLDREGSADAAAGWFMQNFSDPDESALDASLMLTRSRARRIAAWLQEEGELERIWTRRIVVPRIRTGALEALIDADHLDEISRRRIELELIERRADTSLERPIDAQRIHLQTAQHGLAHTG